MVEGTTNDLPLEQTSNAVSLACNHLKHFLIEVRAHEHHIENVYPCSYAVWAIHVSTCLHACIHAHLSLMLHSPHQVPAATKKEGVAQMVDFALVRRSELLQLEERIGGKSMDICDVQDVSNDNIYSMVQ